MSDSPLCSFPTSSSTTKSALSAYTPSVRPSPGEKMAQVPHNALPSTSTATSPLFTAHQLMSQQSIQAMENTFLSQNPFLNPAFNPLAAFSSPPDIARVQQWFQQNSPYTSPTPSSTPSLASNLSALSIFSTDSSFTLNSQQLNKFVKSDDTLDPLKDPQKFLSCFLEAIKNGDQDVFIQSLKPLKMFVSAIAKRKIPTEFNQRDFRELIKILLERLTLLNDQRSLNYLLEVLDIIVNQQQFELAIIERKTPILPVFVGLLQRIAPFALDNKEHYRHALQSGLIIVNRCLSLVKDKSGARTELFFDMLLSILRIDGRSSLKYVSLSTLRCLIYKEKKWKQFVFDRQVIELVSSIMEKFGNKKIFVQALHFFNTLLNSEDTHYAESFVRLGGINILMRRIAASTHCSEEDFVKPLICLKLVSDARAISTQNLSPAINFAIRGTFPSRESKPGVYWENIVNALTFLRNAIILNGQARDYLASMDDSRAVIYFGDLARQCMDVGEAAADNEKVNHLKRSMLDDLLMILAILCKGITTEEGNLSDGQKNVTKIIANNETILLIYQAILCMDTASVFKLQKTVLTTLNRITNSGVLPAVFDRGYHLSETLLNFLSSRFDSSNSKKLDLMKMCAEVLHRMIVARDKSNLTVILSSIKSHGEFRPFELLHSFTNGGNLDSDLYLAMLKIIKELCKSDSVLKSQWSNLENVQFLSSNSTMSNNPKISRLCKEVLDMLQMGEDQFQDTLFDLFMNECVEK